MRVGSRVKVISGGKTYGDWSKDDQGWVLALTPQHVFVQFDHHPYERTIDPIEAGQYHPMNYDDLEVISNESN